MSVDHHAQSLEINPLFRMLTSSPGKKSRRRPCKMWGGYMGLRFQPLIFHLLAALRLHWPCTYLARDVVGNGPVVFWLLRRAADWDES